MNRPTSAIVRVRAEVDQFLPTDHRTWSDFPFEVDSKTPSTPSSSSSRSSPTLPIRAAPGKRGPVPTSCEACRRQRAKCIRSKGGQVGEEACTRCVKKGTVCSVSREITRKPRAVTPRAEQFVVTAQFSTARATRLFDLYFDTSIIGLELSYIPLLLHDTMGLRARYDALGGQLDRLEEDEQLRCRLIWSSAAKRWSELDGTPHPSSPSSRHLLKTCREVADSSKIWRTATRPNLVTLLLLFWATANGDLTSNEAQYYISAACQHIRPIYSPTGTIPSPSAPGLEWPALAAASYDALSSLESRKPCFLSDRDFAILSPDGPPMYLAPPSSLASYLAVGSSKVVEHCAQTTLYWLYTARLLASHQARLSRDVTMQQDFDLLDAVWNRSDTLERWLEDAFALIRATGLDVIDLAMLQILLGTSWLPALHFEFAAASYLRERVDEMGRTHLGVGPVGHSSGSHESATKSLHSVAVARSERALCIFLRHTRNREGIYLLAAGTGYVCSVERLNDLAAALYHAKVDNSDLFPFGAADKLASLTFFLKSLQTVQHIYDSTFLADSILSLGALRTRLEFEIGRSAESILGLFTSHSLEGPLPVPDTPPRSFVQAAIAIHRGTAV